nr:hypothetical protein [Escherichia coli]
MIFLRQQNGALSVEILYFLAGSVMHHSGVVNNTTGVFLSARVVQESVWRETTVSMQYGILPEAPDAPVIATIKITYFLY